MHSSMILGALAATLASASTAYQVSDYISDTISGWSNYQFNVTYTPPSPHSTNTEPAFSTICKWDTDDAADYRMCDDKSVKTLGDFSTGSNKLTVVHSWTVVSTGASAAHPATPAKDYSRTAKKTVQAYLGGAGQPASFSVTGGSEVPAPPVAKTITRRREGQARRDLVNE